jgi:hypothetical protein
MSEKYLIDDDSLFVGFPCKPKPVFKNKINNWSHSIAKRDRTELQCIHCERLSSHLFFNIGCTAECTLAHVFRNCSGDEFNLVFIHFFDPTNQQNMPRRAFDKERYETSKDYWERTLKTLYELSDPRFKLLVTRLNETCPFKTIIQCSKPSIKDSLVVKKKKF